MPQRQNGSPDLHQRRFPRRIDSVPAVLGFVDEVSRSWGLPPLVAGDLKVALDELFTNMVKYQPGNRHEITIEAAREARAILVRITDRTSQPFDITRRPDPDLSVPLEQREPRGLGIYFVKHLMDDVRYTYDRSSQEGTITLLKRLEESNVSDREG